MWRSTWRSAGALLCLIATLSFSAHAQLFGNSYGDDKYPQDGPRWQRRDLDSNRQ